MRPEEVLLPPESLADIKVIFSHPFGIQRRIIPHITTTEQTAIATASFVYNGVKLSEGDMLYNTTTHAYVYYNGTAFVAITAA